MAEFVEKRCEDMIPCLEQMERIKLFDKNEIREIAKKRREFEYKIQRHTKCKEDFLRYIQYEMDLLKLIKQRREKFGNTFKKSDIDYTIANKVNSLYRQAIFKFQEDLRFWIAYMKFCKQVRFHGSVSRMIVKMLQVHQDKPKCWHIAARWEIEESKNIINARKFLLRGLHFHPDSQLLFTDAFTLELDEADATESKAQADNSSTATSETINEMSLPLKRAFVIYQQAFKRIKDVTFIIELLNIAKEHKNTGKLQHKIITDMIQEYANKPQMWNIMARRELEGLTYDIEQEDSSMETDAVEASTLRDRISGCNEIYQTGVKKIKTELMWSFYIDCLIEINQDLTSLPNYKRKLLKNALMQGHQARKLHEKYYLHWVEIIKSDKKEENTEDKIYKVLCNGTDALPTSVTLWHAKLEYLINAGQDELIEKEFNKAIETLKENALPIWRMKLLYVQAKHPNKVQDVFQAAMQEQADVTREMNPAYIEWLVLTKGIQAARQAYSELNLQPPPCLELHKKMAALELIQPDICKQNARRPHELAALQFGKTNTDIWINYIIFEMKHGDPIKVADIHRRAVKTLEPALTDIFISEYSLISADPNSITHIP
ncbi:hypothetical protein PV328_006270 [Microctonus aethiopoides]|uniref:U3 small nucleolar RNA-associated protein 6 homolog n=1 Tax=Microctonus aethiopoides TaxID=144406 RepID=A0AA39FP95_9HYME|nr:hypothetical protein PV328_006270 [Microctonus aethiopoides]